MTDRQSVQCKNVVVRAGGRDVVSGLSWTHHAGGIAWLVGSNGSGKSSLLRAIAGWQKIAGGAISWSGIGSRGVRFFAPNMNGTPELRVADFVEFAGQFGVASTSAELDALFPHSADLSRSFKQLSTGEAKRLLLWSLFRMDAEGPIVLDEPYEHLSREAKQALTTLLHDASARSAVIVATNQEVPPQRRDTMLVLDNTFVTVHAPETNHA